MSRDNRASITRKAGRVGLHVATIAAIWSFLAGGAAAQDVAETPPLPEGAVARLGGARFRHTNRVTAVGFSPDGKLLVTGDSSPSIRLWDVSTGAAVFRIRGFPIPYDVCFHPDGKSIAASTPLGVRLFEVPTGRPLRKMEVPAPEDRKGDQCKNAIAFADGGRVVLVASGWSKKIHAWEVTSGREIAAIDWPDLAGFTSIAVAADGKRIAAGGRLGLWDWPSPGEGIRKEYGDESISSLAFAPGAGPLALGGWRGTVRIVDPSDGTVIRDWKAHTWGIWSVVWAPDGSRIATSGHHNILRIWSLDGEKVFESGEARIPNPPARAIDYAPDGRTIAVANGNAIRLWDLTEGRPIVADSGHLTGVTAVAFSRDGKRVATGGRDGTVRLWDAATGRERAILPCPPGVIRSLSFSPDGRRLLAAAPDNMSPGGAVWLWDVVKGEEIHTWENEKEKFEEARFSAGRDRIVARVGVRFEVIDLDSKEAVKSFDIPSPYAGEALISPDGSYAACHVLDSTAGSIFTTLLDLETGDEVVRLGSAARSSQFVRSLAFSPGARVLITATKDDKAKKNEIHLWETLTGSKIRTIPAPEAIPHTAALSPDGHTVAVAWWNRLELYDLDVDGIQGEISIPNGVGALGFSPDGRLIATTLYDTTVLLWRVGEGETPETAAGDGEAAEEVRRSWAALASPDAGPAFKAIADLAERRAAALALLEEEFARCWRVDPEQIRSLIRDLGAEEFERREAADAALRELGVAAAEEIRAALAAGPDPEVTVRLGRIIESLEDPRVPGGRGGLRWTRAVQVLERIATEDARRLLGTMARDCPLRRARTAASQALGRLPGRGGADPGR